MGNSQPITSQAQPSQGYLSKVRVHDNTKFEEILFRTLSNPHQMATESLAARVQLSPSASPPASSSTAESPIPHVTKPASKKRSTPDQSDEEPTEETPAEPASKRRRIEGSGLQSPPPEVIITATLDARPTFDDESSHLLRRSAALVLEHVGFDGASKEALESFCGEIDSYATKFLSYVMESMMSARRSAPTPLDFEYALRREGLTARLLKPHLKPPIPANRIKPRYSPAPMVEADQLPVVGLLGPELSGESEKRAKSYIPKRFPSFPSKHTYKSTDVLPHRETDPRKIREKATEESRRGEEALRRLVNIGKAGDHKGVRRGSENKTKQTTRHVQWEEAMDDLARENAQSQYVNGLDGTVEQSIVVNSEKPYGRIPAARLRKGITTRGTGSHRE